MSQTLSRGLLVILMLLPFSSGMIYLTSAIDRSLTLACTNFILTPQYNNTLSNYVDTGLVLGVNSTARNFVVSPTSLRMDYRINGPDPPTSVSWVPFSGRSPNADVGYDGRMYNFLHLLYRSLMSLRFSRDRTIRYDCADTINSRSCHLACASHSQRKPQYNRFSRNTNTRKCNELTCSWSLITHQYL